jgi:hypothetical protein
MQGFSKALGLLVFAVLVLGSGKAHAGFTRWSNVGSGCVVDTRFANAVINSQDGSVRFATGVTGTVLLTCPINAFTYTATAVSHVFDFDFNYYWVNIEMSRSSTSQNPVFYGTSMSDGFC